MPKTKISEFSATPANNTDIDSINISEGCAPSGINDAIRELMAQLKDFQTGAVGDSFNGPIGAATASTGAFTTLSASGNVTLSGGTANGVAYLNGSKVVTSGSALTFDGTNFATTGNGTFSGILSRIHAQGTDAYITNTTTGKANTVMGFNDSGSTTAQGIPTGYAYYGTLQSYPIGFTSGGYLTNSISSTAHIWNTTGTEQMRLTSTGLGIGTSSPSYKLDVNGNAQIGNATAATNRSLFINGVANKAGRIIFQESGVDKWYIGNGAASENGNFEIYNANGNNTVLTPAGNLGLGVTPSAWASYRALSLGNIGSSIAGQTAAKGTVFTSNAYYNSGWKYADTGVAAFFDVGNNIGGGFTWNQAASGTAGNAITFTQAMTLDASGRLGVGTTSPSSYGGWISVDIRGSNGGQLIVANSAATNIGEIFTDSNGFNVSARTNNAMLFKTNDAERARIDSSGRFGLGMTPSGSYSLQIYGIGSAGSGSARIRLNNSSTGTADADGGGIAMEGVDLVIQNSENGVCKWEINGSERARIDSSGNYMVATTSVGGTISCARNGNTYNYYATSDANNTTEGFFLGYSSGASANRIIIYSNGNVVNANNSYGALSDSKLKENIVDATPKLAGLMQVKVRNYNLIGETTKQLGVVAQELETVFPAMVDESPDKDAEGNDLGTTTKSVKYSVFVPMLIKALQEQQAIIESLKARLDAANL